MKLITTFALAFTVATAAAQSPVLTQMDAAAKTFKSAQADVTVDIYTVAAKASETQTGKIYIERKGASQSMGAIYYDAGSKTPKQILSYNNGTFQNFTPENNQDDVFKAGDNRGKYESFLTIGFGGSGADLAKAWTIKDLGPDTINGTKVEKLDLVGKDESVRNTFTHVTLWIDPTRGISLKQIFYTHGEIKTVTYSNIKLNANIDKAPYTIPGKANKIPH